MVTSPKVSYMLQVVGGSVSELVFGFVRLSGCAGRWVVGRMNVPAGRSLVGFVTGWVSR